MGQRHQLWLIAKVVPHGSTDNKPVYRSLGGYYHGWCYGRLPVQATRRFLDLATQKENAKIIQYELENIQGKYGESVKTQPQMPKIPCSYLMYVAAMAWCFDLDQEGAPYISGHSFEPSLIASNESSFCRGPDDGITVIDVTDIFNPAYCHVLGEEPISAERYVRNYYPNPGDDDDGGEPLGARYSETEAHVREVIASLDGVRLLPIDALAEVWPREYKRKRGSDAQEPSVDTVVTGPVADEEPENRDNPIPQLSELTINLAVQQSADEEDFSALEQLVWMPGKADQIISLLRQMNPFPDAALSLLGKALDVDPKSDALDLSGSSLSSSQIACLLCGRSNIKSLDLSKMPNVTIEAIRKILTSIPTIACLKLLGTPITDEDVVELLENEPKLFYHMETFLHPVFLTCAKEAPYKSTLWFPGVSLGMIGGAYPALPFFTPQRVVHMLWEYLSALNKSPFGMFSSSISLFASACMSCGPRPDGQKWRDRSIVLVPASFSGFGSNGGHFLAVADRNYAFVPVPRGGEESDSTDGVVGPPMGVRDFVELLVKEGRPAPTDASLDRLTDLIDEIGMTVMPLKEVVVQIQMAAQYRAIFLQQYMGHAPV